MRTRWTIFGLAIGLVLALGVGAAVASGPALPRAGVAAVRGDTGTASDAWAAMEAMHDSPAMQQMHSQMPADLQQRCNELHDQMAQWAGQHPDFAQGGMMGSGSGTGSGMMGSGSGTIGSGSGSGMMGSGSGMMGS